MCSYHGCILRERLKYFPEIFLYLKRPVYFLFFGLGIFLNVPPCSTDPSTWPLLGRRISRLQKTICSCDINECPDGTLSIAPERALYREFERNEMRNIKIAATRAIIVALHRKLGQHKYVFVMKMVPQHYIGKHNYQNNTVSVK